MAGERRFGAAADPVQALVLIRDVDGHSRGLGFVADLRGTVLTAHETVAGLSRLELHTAGGRTRVLGPDRIEPLPEHGLALLHTDGLGGLPVPPLPIAAGAGSELIAVPQFRPVQRELMLAQGSVLATGSAMYPWADAFHVIEGALRLDLPRLATAPTAGAPVLDAETGAVLGVVAPGLRSGHHGGVPAAPTAGTGLTALLARNAAEVPAYGRALNLAGVLHLASVQLGSASAGPGRIADLAADRVDRPDGLVGEEPQHPHTVLVGETGSGRTTELAALTVRRAGGRRPLPTLWLRGADLAPGDLSVTDPVRRELARAAGLLAVDAPGPDTVARLCAAAGRPLLVVLDAPEEAPAAVTDPWLAASAEWLQAVGARLLTCCRPDGRERCGARPGDDRVHRLGPLPAEAADRAARRHGLPPGWPARPDAAHPLALRLASELCAAGVRGPAPRRSELFAGYLDLCSLRIAQRLADPAEARRHGAHRRGAAPPVTWPRARGRERRLAAVAAGRIHEAARQLLGAGHGGLDSAAFEALFPAAGGWAQAVLDERLFVPAGPGYRIAHEEFAEWLQGLHLDLDGALRLLLAEDAPETDGPSPRTEVPRHRVGPVVAALARLAETWGATALDPWLHRIRRALDSAGAGSEPAWWAGRLLAAALTASPDIAVHRALLEQLADHDEQSGLLGPDFWAALPLAPATRLDLLRRLVRTDGAARTFRTATAELLAAAPQAVIPLLCRWFEDGRRLAAGSGSTVSDTAHDLLYAYRRLALDELAESLVDAAHPRADALLALLAVEEPSALCRAVDRWSHDPRPERHVAAAVHALRTAPYATGPGRELLRFSAVTLLAREGEPALHGAALALLVRDPQTRPAYLGAALAAYGDGDPFVTAEVLAPALESDPEPVLAALRGRLAAPGGAVAAGLRVLAGAADPELSRRGVMLAAELLCDRPERAAQVAEYLDRLAVRPAADGGPPPGEVLRLLAVAARPPAVRRVFAVLLATPGHAGRGPLLDTLLLTERDPAVLAAVLERLAETLAGHQPGRVRELVRRIVAGDAETDAALVRCAGRAAGLARLLAEWPVGEPGPTGGPLLARMRALVDAGRDPQYAAAEAERGAPRSSPRAAGLPVPRQGRAHGTL